MDRLKKLAVILVLLALSAPALATSISNGESGSSVRTKLNNILITEFNVKDYGAVGDATTNDTTSIQNAITAACANGLSGQQGSRTGGVVIFPAGVYKTVAPLTMCVGNASIHIVGVGRYASTIYGSFTGFIIDKPDDGLQNLEVVRSIGLVNNQTSVDAGALRFNAAEKGLIEDVRISGFTGIEAVANTYVTRISNVEIICNGGSGSPGSVGIFTAQVGVYNTRIQACDVGIQAQNVGLVVHGSAIETTNTAFYLGVTRPNVFTASISGTVMTVTAVIAGPSSIDAGMTISCTGCTAGTTISSRGTGTGGTGTYNVSASQTVSSRTISTLAQSSGLSGFSISGNQTERVNTCMYLLATSGGSIAGNTCTGTVGVGIQTTAASWSGGSITYTTAYPHGMSGSHDCTAENFSPSGYNVTHGTCTWSSTNTVTRVVADPGANTVLGAISPLPQYGIRIRNSTSNVLSGNTVGVSAEVAGLDLTTDGNTSGTGTTLISNSVSVAPIYPPANSKASFSYINNSFAIDLLNFADLPSQSGVYATATEGMEFTIKDALAGNCADGTCNTAFTNVTGGGGALHRQVRWNGTNWTMVGR